MSFRSSAQAEDFGLLARTDVRYMLGSRINRASREVRSGSKPALGQQQSLVCSPPHSGLAAALLAGMSVSCQEPTLFGKGRI